MGTLLEREGGLGSECFAPYVSIRRSALPRMTNQLTRALGVGRARRFARVLRHACTRTGSRVWPRLPARASQVARLVRRVLWMRRAEEPRSRGAEEQTSLEGALGRTCAAKKSRTLRVCLPTFCPLRLIRVREIRANQSECSIRYKVPKQTR